MGLRRVVGKKAGQRQLSNRDILNSRACQIGDNDVRLDMSLEFLIPNRLAQFNEMLGAKPSTLNRKRCVHILRSLRGYASPAG